MQPSRQVVERQAWETGHADLTDRLCTPFTLLWDEICCLVNRGFMTRWREASLPSSHHLWNRSVTGTFSQQQRMWGRRERHQLDLIFCYKIVFGLTSLTSSDYFQLSSNTNTRGHAYKLYIPQNSCSTRRKFLSYRILAVWNSPPANTDFSSLAAFKRTVIAIDLAKFLHYNCI